MHPGLQQLAAAGRRRMPRSLTTGRRSLAGLVGVGVARKRIVWILAVCCVGAMAATANASAAGAGQGLVWSPTSGSGAYNFGALAAGASSSVTFTLTNSGRATGDIGSVTTSGSPAFTVTGDTCTGISLPTHHSCTVTVTYTPTKPGESDTATLVATATQASAGLTLLGSEAAGLSQAPQTITFSSVAPTGATVGGATYTPLATASPSGLPVAFSIDPSTTAGACSISSGAVSFTGAGNCVIDANQAGDADYTAAPQVQQMIPVGPTSGGASAGPMWSPTSGSNAYDFGALAAGATSSVTFTLTNSGDATGDIKSVTTSGSPAFTVAADTCTGISLPTNHSCTVTVTYTPTKPGESDTATLVATATQASAVLTLVGSEVAKVSQAPQTITFSSVAPTDATFNGAGYTPDATASPSGLPVAFSIDPSSSAGACSIDSSGVVSFTGAGTCVIDANQAGDTSYAAAPQVQQTIAVAQAPQTISFTGDAPTDAVLAGAPYTPTATGGGSGNPVMITVDPGSSSVCAVSDGAVNFVGIGTCTLDANQAGDDNWQAAAQVTQSFAVGTYWMKVTINPVDDPQSPPLPPDPATNNCDPPNVSGGGCFINPLDGSAENLFDATQTLAGTGQAGFDPSLYSTTYHWQIYKPPGLGSAPYSSSGITGYYASVLDIQPDSMPELLGTDAGQDFYWRVELTVTINGVETIGWFKFQYQSSTLSLKLSTTCQLTEESQTTMCQFAAANGLPATEPT